MTLPRLSMAQRVRRSSPQATADLAVLAAAGPEEREQALQAFVGKYRGVPAAYAKRWQTAEIDQADLDQEALIAFATAARLYDGRASGFWSFAFWRMRAALQAFVRQVAPLIPVGSRVQKNQRKIGAIGDGETDEQIAARTKLSLAKVRLARAYWGGVRVVPFEDGHAARPRPQPVIPEQLAQPAEPQPADDSSTSAEELIACALADGATYREVQEHVEAAIKRRPGLGKIARLAGKLGLTRRQGRPTRSASPDQLARLAADPAAVPQAWRNGRLSPTRLGHAIGCSRWTVNRARKSHAATGAGKSGA